MYVCFSHLFSFLPFILKSLLLLFLKWSGYFKSGLVRSGELDLMGTALWLCLYSLLHCKNVRSCILSHCWILDQLLKIGWSYTC